MYASLVVVLLNLFGVDADEGQVTEVLLAVATLASFAMWAYGQVARKDLSLGLWRK